MATRLLDRVPLDRIEARARPVDLGHMLMVAVVGVFYVLGWLTAKTVIVLGVVLGWMVAAAKTGWQDAHAAAAAKVEERQRARVA